MKKLLAFDFGASSGRAILGEYENGAFLVFGKETKGLPEELLKANPDSCVRIPMRGEIRSLNLSNSVAVGVFEALRQWGYPRLSSEGRLHELSWDD